MATYSETLKQVDKINKQIEELMHEKSELMQKIDVDENGLCSAVDQILYDGETVRIYVGQILQGRESYEAHNEDGDGRIKLDGGNLRNMLKGNLGMIESNIRIIRDILDLKEDEQ